MVNHTIIKSLLAMLKSPIIKSPFKGDLEGLFFSPFKGETERVSSLEGLSLLLLLLFFSSCANRGIGPQGGPKDTIPPRMVKEQPLNQSVNFHGKKIEITFNEYLQLDNIQQNLLVSPPQQVSPIVKAVGKKVTVEMQEDLIDSTTYTLDFGNAICDYTEKNPLRGYVFAFSTGDRIDSMEVYGRVANAEDLNPVSGLMVGLQANLHDSAFSTLPFTRVARSDSLGEFGIQNLRNGIYRLYALQDQSRDFLYQPGEGLAFSDSLVIPEYETEIVFDTIWKNIADTIDSLSSVRQIDTILTIQNTYVGPADLMLWFFKEDKQRHYFQRVYRDEPHIIKLQFSAPQDSLPLLRALPPSAMDSTRSDSLWTDPWAYTLLQANPTRDTLVYWLTDSLAIRQDSIFLEMTYLKSDSLYNLVPATDTVSAIYRAPRMTQKAKEAQEKKARERKLDLKSNAKDKFEVYDTLSVVAAFPIDSIYTDSIRLYEKQDTLLIDKPFTLLRKDVMSFQVVAPLQQGKQYELQLDSAAVRDIYGVASDKKKFTLKLKTAEDYSTLLIRLPDYDPRIRLQLLSEKDQPVRELPAREEGTKFEYLAPKTYYLRLYFDLNGDGRWTTGDWITKRQPEPVYYFPAKLTLRANWDFEERFDYLARPQLEAKPRELRKDASAAKK
ncbi:MAG: Ig-like domain-containing domain [Paludibacteraceae bacterium]|nr:Ig-like domain-containing domain [Paludibacteraceae bacterium]